MKIKIKNRTLCSTALPSQFVFPFKLTLYFWIWEIPFVGEQHLAHLEKWKFCNIQKPKIPGTTFTIRIICMGLGLTINIVHRGIKRINRLVAMSLWQLVVNEVILDSSSSQTIDRGQVWRRHCQLTWVNKMFSHGYLRCDSSRQNVN